MKNIAKLPTMKELASASNLAVSKGKGTPQTATKAADKGKAAGNAKAAPKAADKAADKGTEKTARRLVYLDLPKGTERFISGSGIEWVRTPKTGDFKRWFQLAPKGTDETGIHGITEKNGLFTLTIERARVPYRELAGNIREMEPAKKTG